MVVSSLHAASRQRRIAAVMSVRFSSFALAAALLGTFATDASAQQRAQQGFRVCNQAGTEIEVAKATSTGASDGSAPIIISEGWYKLPPQACAYLWPGPLQYRTYLVYAQDKASGREWTGQVPICVSPEAFTIRSGTCGARQERKLFIPVNVGNERYTWTYVFRP
jgi:uncharacterized membrane protein